jgi:hypothetical protein
LKKILTWGAIAFVIFYLVKQPGAAANVVQTVAGGLGSAASSLSTFVNNLV